MSRRGVNAIARVPATDADNIGADRVRAIWQERAAREGRGTPAATLGGRRVLSLESRRSPELALLVMNYGGTPIVAPAVREVPIEANDKVLAFAAHLIERRFDMTIMLTGVGVRMMMQVIDALHDRASFVNALAETRIVARGPKPVAALRELGLAPWITAPSPNTWRELIAALDDHAPEAPLSGARLAIQEYGSPNPELIGALEARGAQVTAVPVYRWAMPDDVAPLRRAVWDIIRGDVDIVVLTASVQLVHLLAAAREMELEGAVRRGLERTVVASIGPTTSEELRRQRLPIDFEPSHPKMGFLVKEVAEQCEALLRAKRCVEPVK